MDWEALDAHFVSLYGHKYTDKMQHLRKRLTEYTTGANSFSVVSIEPGLGKSLQSDRCIGEYVAAGGTRKFLLVKRFKEDVAASVDRIN
jgi:hypothetical protein